MLVSKDAWAGAIFCAIGAFFVLGAWQSLGIGTAHRMGPGFLPVGVGGLVFVIGLIVIAGSFTKVREQVVAIPLRGAGLILLTPILFGLLVTGLGSAATAFICCMVAAFASKRMKLGVAVMLAAAMSAFSSILFVHFLGVTLPLAGPWLSWIWGA